MAPMYSSPPTGLMGAGFGSASGQAFDQANQEFANQLPGQKSLLAQQIAGQTGIAQIGAAAQEYGANLQQQRFNQVFPWLQGAYSSGYNPAPLTPAPTVSVTGALTPQQVNQQVNQQTAANNTGTATQVRAMQQRLGGSGMGATSPLAQELQTQMQGQGQATNTANASTTRLNAAQANAQQVLAGQQARGSLWAQGNQQQVAQQQIQAQSRNALLAAIAGLA